MNKSGSQASASFDAISFRKQLHTRPELSGNEAGTAEMIAGQLRSFGLQPVTEVGGHGLFTVIEGKLPGDTTLLRADFDAVAVTEKARHDHVSVHPGVMHACGHDGHTASLLAVARHLAEKPPASGKVILLFQPAEETGIGAKAMLDHPELNSLNIDHAFACHNLPGQPLHQIVVRDGTFACASTGVCIEFEGKTSHAAYPERGVNPVNAMMEILRYLQNMPELYTDTFSLVTIVSAQLGEEAFGVSAGSAKVMATLRSDCNNTFHDMQEQLGSKLKQMEQESELLIHYSWHEPFNAAVNSAFHVDIIREQAARLELPVTELNEPMRWSEDFSQFLLHCPGALFGIGSGVSHPELHNPDYDFPDEILDTAASLFLAIVAQLHS